jgi:hypothetical protein
VNQDDANKKTTTSNFFQSPIGAKAASIMNKLKGNNFKKDKEVEKKKDDLKVGHLGVANLLCKTYLIC